jgi:hypothetical protein
MKPHKTSILVISNIIIPVSREQSAEFPSIDKSGHWTAIRSVITYFDGPRLES